MLNLQVHYNDFVTNDVGFYHIQSLKDLSVLQHEPTKFLQNWLFKWGDASGRMNLFKPENMSFWSSIGMQFHYKYMTLSNIFSMGSIHVNVIFYNLLYFAGQLALYKTVYRIQPEKKLWFLVSIFLIPSVLFWCSGIHKDGLILAAVGFVFYFLHRFLTQHRKLDILYVLLFLIMLSTVRYFYVLIILPGLFGWVVFHQKQQQFLKFCILYILAIFVLFNIDQLLPAIQPLQLISNKQSDFKRAIGYSDMRTPDLLPTWSSYVKNFPIALQHIFLQPSFSWQAPIKYQLAALDAIVVLALIILFAVHVRRNTSKQTSSQAIFYTMLFIGISVYIFIGYTIPNCGALVRYKSEFTVLLLTGLIGLSDIPTVKKLVYFK